MTPLQHLRLHDDDDAEEGLLCIKKDSRGQEPIPRVHQRQIY
jgi:hypothetical protein